jgi:predicted RNA-binding protein with PIN domain
MPLLIDGYNLLNVTGIVGRGVGPGTLERSRLALLNFLAESLEPKELPHTTVVFDAKDAPPGLPRTVEHRGMTIRFAAKHESADELIGELIRADFAPRRLVVVSSDHEIQRAARRRRAKAVDSDAWYSELIRARWNRRGSPNFRTSENGTVPFDATADTSARPPVPLLEEDINYWLRQFGGESALTELWAKETGQRPPSSEKSDKPDKPSESEAGPIDNPFPPGYGEDLLREM